MWRRQIYGSSGVRTFLLVVLASVLGLVASAAAHPVVLTTSAARPDTKLMVLQLADLPSGFMRMTGHYESNAQARARLTRKPDFDALGRLIGYTANYQKPPSSGLVWVNSDASLYRSAAHAHKSFLESQNNLGNSKTFKFQRLAVGAALGDEARLYKVTAINPRSTAYAIDWRSGTVYASIVGVVAPGSPRSVDPADFVALAIKQQARISSATH